MGALWYAAQERAGQLIAYVYDIHIQPRHQRQGHATAALRALELEVRRHGLSGIALHVFGHNAAARALYEHEGFATTNIHMFKPVGGADRTTAQGVAEDSKPSVTIGAGNASSRPPTP